MCRFFKTAAAKLHAGDASTDAIPPLLAAFQHLESLVVAAESLLLRLPGDHQLVNRLLEAATAQLTSLQGDQNPAPDGKGRSVLQVSADFLAAAGMYLRHARL